MIKVIKNIKVYSPKYLGVKDVVIVGNKFEGIYDSINIPTDFINVNVYDGTGKIMLPGFIDSHVHILGGGGEKGFSTRTPEMRLIDLSIAGITTVVGCLGTDNICRSMSALIAKARALEIEGLNTYCYTGSYEIPVKSLTESIKEDIMMIDKIIGLGEIALSDHRSSQPTYEEFLRAISQARVGGLLSGKSGIVNVHLGGGKQGLEYLFKIIEETEIPSTQLLPTHINRNSTLFKEGLEYVKKGGYIDLTTSSDPKHLEPGEISAGKGLKIYLDEGLPIEHITFTSDGNGSMPKFDGSGREVGIGICKVDTLYKEVKRAILEENVAIEDAIKVITSNVANILCLHNKGRIEKSMDADFVTVDENTLDIVDVFTKESFLVKDGEIKVHGVYS